MVSIPLYVWLNGAHWLFVAIFVVVFFLAAGFIAERVLFKLSWAEKIFGKPEPKPLGSSTYEQELARRSKNRYVDFKDLITEVDLADGQVIGLDLDKKEFTFEDEVPSILEEDLFDLAKKGMPERDPKKYHIDEKGIRITSKHGPENFYTHAEIEEIELKYYEVDSGIAGEGKWERPLPIYKANLLFFTAAGTRYDFPFMAPSNAKWFVIRKYNALKEREYRKVLEANGEIPIGRSNINESVFMSSKGFRSRSIFIPVEELWQVTIRKDGGVNITGKGGHALYMILDYALPETYVILRLIREMVEPKAIPLTDKKYAPGALNKMKSHKTGSVFAAISLICFVFSGYYAFKGIGAANWPEARGTVLSTKIRYDEPFSAYELKVSYRYEIDGKNYTDDTFKYGTKLFEFEKSALRLAKKFPKGQEIPVYYNPGRPDQAVLESGVGFHFYFIRLRQNTL